MSPYSHFQRKYKKRTPAEPAVLDMTKVLAAAANKPCTPARHGIDMDRVNAAVAARTPRAIPAPPAHMALPAEDAGRRKPIAQLGKHCPGISHFNFEFNR